MMDTEEEKNAFIDVWVVYSRILGRGPIFCSPDAAAGEMVRLFDENPHDTVSIVGNTITQWEFENLPEFLGY